MLKLGRYYSKGGGKRGKKGGEKKRGKRGEEGGGAEVKGREF